MPAVLPANSHHHHNREEGEFGAALVGKKVRVFQPEQLRYVEVSSGSPAVRQ